MTFENQKRAAANKKPNQSNPSKNQGHSLNEKDKQKGGQRSTGGKSQTNNRAK